MYLIYCHYSFSQLQCTRAALKAMPPILLCRSMMSEVDGGGMAVEVKSSHQYSITVYCHMRDGSRGAVCENCIWKTWLVQKTFCYLFLNTWDCKESVAWKCLSRSARLRLSMCVKILWQNCSPLACLLPFACLPTKSDLNIVWYFSSCIH